jgi:hypothetical protein
VGTEACTVFAEVGGKSTCDAAELATLIADVGYGVRPDSEAEGAQLQLDVDHMCVLALHCPNASRFQCQVVRTRC